MLLARDRRLTTVVVLPVVGWVGRVGWVGDLAFEHASAVVGQAQIVVGGAGRAVFVQG